MAYQVIYRREPAKSLRRLQRAKAQDIMAAVDRIAAAPFAPNNNLRPLKGMSNGFRVRAGDWRVSYIIDREAQVTTVFEVAPRGGAYR